MKPLHGVSMTHSWQRNAARSIAMKLCPASVRNHLHRAIMASPPTRRSARLGNQAKLLSSFKPSKVSKPSTTKTKTKSLRAAAASKAVVAGEEEEPTLPEQRSLIASTAEAATNLGTVPSRPASPTATNAPLETPTGDVVTSYQPSGEKLGGAPAPTTRTGSILEEAKAHLLTQAPQLAPLIAQHECPLFTEEGLSEVVDPFQSLASGIISQQVSGAAAKSIKNKFVNLFSELGELTFPTPAMVLKRDLATLRTAGLSQRKAEYMHSLANAFESGDVSAEFFATAGSEEIIQHLIKIHGIGRWSAEMFLMFGLRRLDVFSTGDLGIQRGMAAFVGRNVKNLKASGKGKWKYMNEADMLSVSEKFKPYRTLFCWYMWRCEGTDVDAMGNVKKPKPSAKAK